MFEEQCFEVIGELTEFKKSGELKISLGGCRILPEAWPIMSGLTTLPVTVLIVNHEVMTKIGFTLKEILCERLAMDFPNGLHEKQQTELDLDDKDH